MPTSAYIHVPFCRHRCGYCNFAVVTGRDDLVDDYLRAIEEELSRISKPQPVRTLYIGGGTPTRLPSESLDALLRLVSHWFPPLEGDRYAEWTVEANPGDFSEGTIELLAERGVTRLSLGVQSLNAKKLGQLERDHTPEQVEQVLCEAKAAGLEVAVDLIFAAPGETLDDWLVDLEQAIALAPNHVSTYGLTYEQGTSFWSRRLKGTLNELGEDLQRDMYLAAIDRLTAAGLVHYEISNHAQPGCRSQHNEAYWAGEEYFAVGPGAARYIDGIRSTNHRSTTTYLKRVLAGGSPVAEQEELTPEERARERLIFGLRRLEGVERDWFHRVTGYELDALAGPTIEQHVEWGLLEDNGKRVRLTRQGLLVSDAIWPEML